MVKIPETVEELKELVRRYDNALIFDCMSDDEYELNKNKEWMAECELVFEKCGHNFVYDADGNPVEVI